MSDWEEFESYENDDSDWVDENESGGIDIGMDTSPAELKQGKVETDKKGQNVALLAFQHTGKSLNASMYGFLNTKYFDKIGVKEKYPKTYEMIKTGVIPEVEELHVLDLDGSFEKLSHKGIFGRLVEPLYRDGVIKRTEIKIPKVKVDSVNKIARQVSKKAIDTTKAKIENTIHAWTRDDHEGCCMIIDSMSSYDELLNDKFRLLYEDVLAEEDQDHVGGSLKGVKQSYWKIRNGWWTETLRDKRGYSGFQIDTYKLEPKQHQWLEKEIDAAKKSKHADPDDILPFKIIWAPRTEYDLDMIHLIRTNVHEEWWMETLSRFEGNKRESGFSLKNIKSIYFTPNKREVAYELMEALAPSLLGEVEDEEGNLMTNEDLW